MNAALPLLELRRLDTRAADFAPALEALIAFEAAQDPAVDAAVAAIVADVRARGDAALLDYTRRFDRMDVRSMAELTLAPAEMARAHAAVPAAQRDALQAAAARIRAYHERQKGTDWGYREADGTELGHLVSVSDAPVESRH